MRRIFLQLFPQAADVDHQGIFVSIVAIAPYGVTECVESDDLAAVFVKLFYNKQFLGSQRDFPGRPCDDALIKMNRAFPQGKSLGLRCKGTAGQIGSTDNGTDS